VLPRGAKSVAAILDAGLTRDPDAQVRLVALLALADQPATRAAGEAIVAALGEERNTEDRWIPDAATCAAANNSESFLKALSAKKEPSAKFLTTIAIVAEHYARGGPVDSVGGVIAALAEADPQVADVVVRGLGKGWPSGKRPTLDDQTEQALEKLVRRLPPGRRGTLVQLATVWGSKKFESYAAEAVKVLREQVKNEKLSAAERVAAARELVGHRGSDKETVESLLGLIAPDTPAELAVGLLEAVRGSEVPEAGRLILERLGGLTPSLRAAGLSVLLSRPEWTRALLESADKGKVRLTELSLDQKQALAEHPVRAIRDQARRLLARGGVLPNPDRQKVVEELLAVTKEKGDPAAGKLVFKNRCAKCHVHGGEGSRIGPDLTGMAVHSKEHLLIDILDPSRSVEANFRTYKVTTKKGVVLTGLLASESRTAIELFDAEGKRQTVLRADIEELEASTKSLMPDGFEKEVSRKDLTDLLEFLTQRGKYLTLPLEKAATVVSTRGMFNSEDSRVERLVFADWKPKTFEGVPFTLIDPEGDRIKNVILLHGPQGKIPPKMPRSVSLPCNAPARAIHLLSGVSGWGHPLGTKGSVSLIVRLHYEDGKTEDHELKNGEHFADYIRRVDVPGSKFAFDLGGRQVRYLAVEPKRKDRIERVELVKGSDDTAPLILAVTVEAPE
jgi:putative heme-binding domain-containing protein